MAMATALTILVGGGLTGAAVWYNSPGRRRKRYLAQPFPPEWEEYLQRNVVLYRMLPPNLQAQLRSHVQIFLGEKNFEGCGGLRITDEMRVTIAGLACLLLINRETSYYKGLATILVYPQAYIVNSKKRDGFVEWENEGEGRLGESWGDGTVVLSWCDVTRTSYDPKDGHNLVLHEFAHQLDQEDGDGDGVPILEQRSKYTAWSHVLNDEYHKLVELTEKGKKDVLQAYGATNPAEFFAVATEAFFEKPKQLHKKHPELYAQLKDFFHLDPETWNRAAAQENKK
jgi:MtfA peptidase